MLFAEVLINSYSSDSKDAWMRSPRIPMPSNNDNCGR